ncbi:AAA family ATPase [Alkalibacillus almallahensis]|uniref:AAA family ATPase n=1 Tax=Alkalibacillus almallahensis TaxID=1379154 RepID=UPI001421D640|nr:AAA family ATPase [Alkalibacillus almallahensis]NIK12273.1 uridine kinase [Alkalibacillus almallahensis]
MSNVRVIAVSSVCGGGKTTVTNELRGKLGNAEALHFDNYNFNEAPDDLIKWVEQGADYNQWNLSPLIADLESLLERDNPPEYIILDYPFSYKNDDLKSLINFSIYIDTPLDIAMARRLARDYHNATSGEIQNDLNFYLNYGRTAYLEMENTIKPNADFVIDGSLTVFDIVDTILKELRYKF